MSAFEIVSCLVCSCFQLPPYGKFTVGTQYSFEYLMDAEKVVDDLGAIITFPESTFKACFDNFGEAITSYSPMVQDCTTYHIYLVICDSNPALKDIKAYAKIMHVNYLEAKKMLTHKRNLIASENAANTGEILRRLNQYQVHYEVEPEYPYEI